MNVNRIQRLSEEHESLIRFHGICNHNDVEFTVKVAGQSNAATLDYTSTKSIIAEVQGILLDRIEAVKEEIIQEAH